MMSPPSLGCTEHRSSTVVGTSTIPFSGKISAPEGLVNQRASLRQRLSGALEGVRLGTTKQLESCRLLLVPTRTPWRPPLALYLCLELMSGSTLIISSTRMSDLTM